MKTKQSNNNFWNSLHENELTFQYYFKRLTQLAISSITWVGMPKEIDIHYFERKLLYHPFVAFSYDGIAEKYVCLPVANTFKQTIYGVPSTYSSIGENGTRYNNLDSTNSVLIYSNVLRTCDIDIIKTFCERLFRIDRIIDININAQKTPVAVQADQKDKASMLNLYAQYDGNAPFIFPKKNIDLEQVRVLKTDAPFIADRLYQLKTEIWNEALCYLGISNVSIQKKERLTKDEVNRSMGGTIASKEPRLASRRIACEKINSLFGLNVSVSFNSDIDIDINGNISEPLHNDDGGVYNE